MRAQRQKVKMLQQGGADPDDIVIAKAKYQAQLQEYKNFYDEMELTPQMQRVYIDGLGRVAFGKRLNRITNEGLKIRSPGSTASFRRSLRSIREGKAGLSKARQEILNRVPEKGMYCDFKKDKITNRDLAYLSAATGDEFALFRGKHSDRLLRGNSMSCDIPPEIAKETVKEFEWIAHTHVDMGPPIPSREDRETLRKFNQKESIIISHNGEEISFTSNDFDV